MTTDADDSSAPQETSCKFFIEKKQRKCKIVVVPGREFCGIHLAEVGFSDVSRVKCPHGNHTVPISQLDRHLKKCTDLLISERWKKHPCYAQGVNAGDQPPLCLPDAPPELADSKGRVNTASSRRLALAVHLGPHAFKDLLRRIEKTEAMLSVIENEQTSIIWPKEAERFMAGAVLAERKHNSKHVVQQASIVGNMAHAGLLQAPKSTVFVEFAAGTGYLTCMLADCYPEARELVMMDVGRFKFLADRSLRNRNMSRIRCNIIDFDPNRIQSIQSGAPWVAHGKHLCGAATDLALRCAVRCYSNRPRDRNAEIINTRREERPSASDGTGGLLGLAMASCCHHRCEWEHYVGNGILQELGFSPEEFELICYMTGWALCGHDREASSDDLAVDGPADCVVSLKKDVVDKKSSDWRPHHSMPRPQRITVGQRCKRLLDFGRIEWLRRRGLSACSVQYVQPHVSGENRLLVASSTTAGVQGDGSLPLRANATNLFSYPA